MIDLGTAARSKAVIAEQNAGDYGRDLWAYIARHRPAIDAVILDFLPSSPTGQASQFNAAVQQAIFPGGKRFRPVLVLLGAELFGASGERALIASAAAEFIHTSSLIFDDLPSMDDASSRRGARALHIKFGEATATLVALSFLNASYRLVMMASGGDGRCGMRALEEVSLCIGPEGMIGGQIVDLQERDSASAGKQSGSRASDLKTSSLVRLSLNLGAIVAGADTGSLVELSAFASKLGDAYQKGDDFDDIAEDMRCSKGRFDEAARRKELRSGIRRDVDAARDILRSAFSPSPARECLLQLATHIENRALVQ